MWNFKMLWLILVVIILSSMAAPVMGLTIAGQVFAFIRENWAYIGLGVSEILSVIDKNSKYSGIVKAILNAIFAKKTTIPRS
jgi:hypothetical protein